MWKIVVGFILFAALALYLLSKGGDIDMSGEKAWFNDFFASKFSCILNFVNYINSI